MMIEGGAAVLRSALVARANDGPIPLACYIIVTVAPRFFLSGLPLLAPAVITATSASAWSSSEAVEALPTSPTASAPDADATCPAVSLGEICVIPEPPGGDGDVVICGSLIHSVRLAGVATTVTSARSRA